MNDVTIEALEVHRADGSPVVHGVSLSVPENGSLGVIGESGSGKSLTLRSAAGLLPHALTAASGRVRVGAHELSFPCRAGQDARFARETRIAMIFQDPSMALDPLMRVERQLGEVHRRHHPGERDTAQAVRDLLADVELGPDIARRYPHEISGGQRQRIVIAMALATEPSILLCDEPTTALDVTVQAKVIELLKRLRRERGLTLLFVSHDLPVVAAICDRIAVMRDGRIVETGTTEQIIDAPQDPYTRLLVHTAREAETPLQELRRRAPHDG